MAQALSGHKHEMMLKIIKQENDRREWEIETVHGKMRTPIFMPDATYGTIQALSFKDVETCGIKAVVSTTLHLEQKMDSKFIKEFGGLHKFIGWQKPLLTDSGGFQVFSLIHRSKLLAAKKSTPAAKKKQAIQNKITDAGCSFIDYKTGDYNFLSPEISQAIQHNLGGDIRVVLDEPIIEDDSLASIKRSVERTTQWAKRSKKAFLELNKLTEKDFNDPKIKRPLLTAVIQGANNFKYRQISAESLIEIGFDIYGFGGLPLHDKFSWHNDAPTGFYHDLITYTAGLIPVDKIRYGLGMGTPDDLRFAAGAGWDIFDSVLPTRNARHGYLYVNSGQGDHQYKTYDVLHITSLRYEKDERSVDGTCDCECCRSISRAYLRYLLKIKNPTGYRYATIHNLRHYAKIFN
jgi:queuine tRNA-ribosyltransferase